MRLPFLPAVIDQRQTLQPQDEKTRWALMSLSALKFYEFKWFNILWMITS